MSNENPDPDAPALPEKPKKSSTPWIIAAILAVVAIVAAIVLPKVLGDSGDEEAAGDGATSAETSEAGDGGSADATDEAPAEPVQVRLGVADAGKNFWNVFVEEAAAEGIEVEIVSFTDYNTPNPALTNGEIDINKFQHVRYLAQYNVSAGEDLVPIGASEIYPIGIYSTQWDSIDEIPEGAEVTLSNNPANQVRPLLALEAAGLIAFEGDPGWSATLDDVDYDNSRIGIITPIDPTQTAASLASVDLAFVDTPFATAAGLTDDELIYTEDPNRDDLAQYINIFAVRAEDEGNEALLTLVEIYHSDVVREAIQAEEGFDGVFKPDTSIAELKATLAEQEEEFANS